MSSLSSYLMRYISYFPFNFVSSVCSYSLWQYINTPRTVYFSPLSQEFISFLFLNYNHFGGVWFQHFYKWLILCDLIPSVVWFWKMGRSPLMALSPPRKCQMAEHKPCRHSLVSSGETWAPVGSWMLPAVESEERHLAGKVWSCKQDPCLLATLTLPLC